MAKVTLKVGDTKIILPTQTVIAAILGQLSVPGEPAQTGRFSDVPAVGEYWPGQGGKNTGLFHPGNGMRDYYLITPDSNKGRIESITWGGYDIDEPGAKSDWDGAANTKALVESETDHPAAQWAAGLVIEGHSDYYLAARKESAFAYAMASHLFLDGWHHTSTQYSPNDASVQKFGGGVTTFSHKDGEWRAQAVRRLFI